MFCVSENVVSASVYVTMHHGVTSTINLGKANSGVNLKVHWKSCSFLAKFIIM